MPLYKDKIVEELEEKQKEFEEAIGKDIKQQFREAAEQLEQKNRKEIEKKLKEYDYPSAIPTEEWEENNKSLVKKFEESKDWSSHESVNKWAKKEIKNKVTISADGSQIDPVEEFEKPVALVQAVWMKNKHTEKGEYEEDVKTEVLTPTRLIEEDENSNVLRVDQEEVSTTRFEKEIEALVEQIEKHGEKPDKDKPVVIYDGPLILSFTEMYSDDKKERYKESLSKLLAASKHHKIPLVGYTGSSKASDIANMIKKLELVENEKTIRDYQLLKPWLENFGDRTTVFKSKRDSAVDILKSEYKGKEYRFEDKILFTYMNTGPEKQLDRIDFPEWIKKEDKLEEVINVLRAEAGVGRGYPEIIQTVDRDAVISVQDRNEFLKMYQKFSEEKNIELEWNKKELSKKRRRR
ncbi:MAG: DNA double-strand break repair nuclease NurA [Candidatus Nanohaloarchaea archaeon]